MIWPTSQIKASRERPAFVLSIDKGLKSLNQATIKTKESIVQDISCVVSESCGIKIKRTPTAVADAPNQKIKKDPMKISESMREIPKTIQYQ